MDRTFAVVSVGSVLQVQRAMHRDSANRKHVAPSARANHADRMVAVEAVGPVRPTQPVTVPDNAPPVVLITACLTALERSVATMAAATYVANVTRDKPVT